MQDNCFPEYPQSQSGWATALDRLLGFQPTAVASDRDRGQNTQRDIYFTPHKRGREVGE